MCRILSASCLVTGPLAKPVSPFPPLVCQHLTSSPQMGQFILMLAGYCLRFVCARGGTICCHPLCPSSSSRSQEYQAMQRLLEARKRGDGEKSLWLFPNYREDLKQLDPADNANWLGQNFSLGECSWHPWRTFPFLLWLWSIWSVHRETWLSSAW